MKNNFTGFKENIINQIHCIATLIDDERYDESGSLIKGIKRQVNLFDSNELIINMNNIIDNIDHELRNEHSQSSLINIKTNLLKLVSQIHKI